MAEQTILEENIRAELRITREELSTLRAQRHEIDAEVRGLVDREKVLKRLAGVYDRANAKKAKTASAVAEVAA